MEKLFDLAQFNEYREDNRREVKKAKNGLPNSLWETYSSFANTNGGVILLGIDEDSSGVWHPTGLKATDERKLRKDFWDTINNRNKVSVNLLSDSNFESFIIENNVVIAILVPAADRSKKPVYINNDMFSGSFRRDYEGDYKCSEEEVKAMLRDQPENTSDMKVLDTIPLSDLNFDTIHSYRNRHMSLKPGHSFERLDDAEYLRCIGAAARGIDGTLHPTAAGLLMFGNEYDIVREYPEYFLDYREELDPTIRWTDRVQSSSGDWTGNLFDFYFVVYKKLAKDIKVPFKIIDGTRIDDTPVHEAIREALANCLINADYFAGLGVVIRKTPESLTFENPGYIRVGKKQMRLGGNSDPRNKALMKIFNLISIGERAGSGVPNIFNVWNDTGWEEPVIEEQFNPDRTVLRLSLNKRQMQKVTIKSDDKKSNDKKVTVKTQKHYENIRIYLSDGKKASTQEIANVIGIGIPGTKKVLKSMPDIIAEGGNKNRRYSLNKSPKLSKE